MNRLSVILLLAFLAPASAQDWSHGACYENGIYFPARDFGQCVSTDKSGFAQTAPPANLQGVISGTIVTGVSTINSFGPRCPADRTVVMIASGVYQCAKDLTDPEK